MKTKIKFFCHLHRISHQSIINSHNKVEECFTEMSITFFLDDRTDKTYKIRNSEHLWMYS